MHLAHGVLQQHEVRLRRRVQMNRVSVLVALAVSACGGGKSDDDASMQPDSTIAEAASDDGSVPSDASVGDAKWWWYVDGGSDCGIPDVGPCHTATIYACCNGTLCAGRCIQLADASTPQCYCAPAALLGGCPNGTVCCGNGLGCVSQMSCGTIGPPPPNCN